MIKRILNPDEISLIIEDIFPIIEEKYQWYIDSEYLSLTVDKECFISEIREALSSGIAVVYSNKEKGSYNALGVFIMQKDPILNKVFLCELVLWSNKPRVGFEIFEEACKLGKSHGYECITMSSRDNNPDKDRFEKILRRKGLVKESSTFVMKL